MRVRIQKLESQAHYINTKVEELEKLSEAEQRYLTKILELNNEYIEQTVVSRLPTEAKALYRANDDFVENGKPALNVSMLIFLFTAFVDGVHSSPRNSYFVKHLKLYLKFS